MRYSVGCSQCRGAAQGEAPCQPCAGNVHFSPGASELTMPAVRIEGLEPYANYTFHVEAHNGVSGLDSSKPASAWLSVHIGHTGERLGEETARAQGGAGSHRTAPQVISSLLPNALAPSGLTEPPLGLSLRLVRKEPRQLELTWAGSRPRSPGGNLTYELHVLNQVRTQLRVSMSMPCTSQHSSLGCRMALLRQKPTQSPAMTICQPFPFPCAPKTAPYLH